MPNQKITNYIKQQLERGVDEKDIREALTAQGWKDGDIEEGFLVIKSEKVLDASRSIVKNESSFSPTGMLSVAFNNYKNNFKEYFGIVVVPYLGMLFLVTLAMGLLSLGGRKFWALEGAGAGFLLFFYTAVIVAVVVFMVVSVWAQAAFWTQVKSSATLGIKEAFVVSKSKIAPYFWTSILASMITVLGFLLFIIPGIIFALWYLFAQMLVVLEDVQGTDALSRSKSYVKGNTWTVFLRLSFAVFIFFVILMPFSIAAEDSAAGTLVYNALSMVVLPIFYLYVFEMYKYLKGVKSSALVQEEGEKGDQNEQ